MWSLYSSFGFLEAGADLPGDRELARERFDGPAEAVDMERRVEVCVDVLDTAITWFQCGCQH